VLLLRAQAALAVVRRLARPYSRLAGLVHFLAALAEPLPAPPADLAILKIPEVAVVVAVE
jgi:hypothetical protein